MFALRTHLVSAKSRTAQELQQVPLTLLESAAATEEEDKEMKDSRQGLECRARGAQSLPVSPSPTIVREHPLFKVGPIVGPDPGYGYNPLRPQRGETERVGFEPTVE